MKYGMYNAAEIVKLEESEDIENFKSEFSHLGYATIVKHFDNLVDIEEYLFNGFFIETPLGNELKRRYEKFVKGQLKNLPPKSKYEYIDSAFSYVLQDENGTVLENSFVEGNEVKLIDKISEVLSQINRAIFIIIEAPAGFGKTCSAYELLNYFSSENLNKLPFFSELSRNREARIFKHILLNEINDQFPLGIKDNIVLEQIKKGRIPLIVDGFDELITRDSTKEEIESMLSTILELLDGKAKIIVTTRKTALFSSEEFFESVENSTKDFHVARFEIFQPNIDNWLSKDKINLIELHGIPKESIENPVLLSYLRNISYEVYSNYFGVNATDNLIDKYLNYLLIREKERQNIKLSPTHQLLIFRRLVALMAEFNFTSESKPVFKEFILSFNDAILKGSLTEYPVSEKPTLEELSETLTNHVFLDRKTNEEIGFVNDFIFGTLVSQNLLDEGFLEENPNFIRCLPQDFAIKSLQASKIQSSEVKKSLWDSYNGFSNQAYDVGFNFYLDYHFNKETKRNFESLILDNWNIKDFEFTQSHFSNCVFTSIKFENCLFDLSLFDGCSFQNCKFINCMLAASICIIEHNNFALYACESNNDFVKRVGDRQNLNDKEQIVLPDIEILNLFLIPKKNNVVPRTIGFIKESLKNYPKPAINKCITSLKGNSLIYFRDDLCFITKKGLDYRTKINRNR
ncbi:MAG: NACHT domain-containing protein [Flavobacteriales bacterium]|nr:NACHT domain-containing protein [Flavobacteriales bacterium]